MASTNRISVEQLVSKLKANTNGLPHAEPEADRNSEKFVVIYDAAEDAPANSQLIVKLRRNDNEADADKAQRILNASKQLREIRLEQWKSLAFQLDQHNVHSPEAFARVLLENKSALPIDKDVTIKLVSKIEDELDSMNEQNEIFKSAAARIKGVKVAQSQDIAQIAWLMDSTAQNDQAALLLLKVEETHTENQWIQIIVTAVLKLRTQSVRPPTRTGNSEQSFSDLISQLAV